MIGEKDPWDILSAKLIEMRGESSQAVLHGQPKTLEAYREEVGYLRAVEEVIETVKEIFKPKTSEFVER
jgi:hypothetical protein